MTFYIVFKYIEKAIDLQIRGLKLEYYKGGMMKGMFVFGSSLVDNGNNNFLPNSLARADYLPYGIDFPLGPSGRFTNGRNVIDLLGGHLKLPSLIPAFADPKTRGSKIVHGVNFASGASGILDDTGSLAYKPSRLEHGHVINMNQQIRNFEEITLPELETQLGCRSLQSLPNYLFVVGTGGNDYSFNYFLRSSNQNVSLEMFTANLTASLSRQLKTYIKFSNEPNPLRTHKLHSLGARKFVVMSVNPLGCSPVVRMNRPTHNGCVQNMNWAAHLFNSHLKSLVDVIRAEMPGSSLVFVNSYKIIRDIIKNPISKGFNDSSTTCCEVASISEGGNGILCKRGGEVCANRSSHVYFDGLHPTEAVNVQIATKAYVSSLKTEVYPTNIARMTKSKI
ncbi:GDSL-like Lipase/Acylhydrolase superfamily protein [Prunus dulcis]|uniref:GDSL-like Lipase/Acylhydrolase superfamily protein n=1 Tax=Prunus dulcis TaxID=3755 RepID=A0A4Y1RZ13_PRUDU|nr:GDSL-like Lipase/Acylhydrolase superfamily protein [Prunus dulcis]